MTDLFGSLGIAPGIAIILAALVAGFLAAAKIRDLSRPDHERSTKALVRAMDELPEAIGKEIRNALGAHLLQLNQERAEWALEEQRTREQRDRDFRADMRGVMVDAIRSAAASIARGGHS